jgi:hypothetical protein
MILEEKKGRVFLQSKIPHVNFVALGIASLDLVKWHI